jgi:hypothetical protein
VDADTVVHPTGSYPADVQAVQAAVDAGGTVWLKALNKAGKPTAFDFGPPVEGSGRVFLTSDVEIRGETHRHWRTTIRGGDPPFLGIAPVHSAIKGIRFERPRIAAVYLQTSSGAEIIDNVISDVVGVPFSAFGRKAQGVWIGPEIGPVTGSITIAGNTIADMDAEDGLGLALVGFEADVKVIGNDIRGVNFVGILAFAHVGRVWIQDNVVVPGPERFPGFFSVGNAIQVGPFFAADFERPPGPAHVRDNHVVCENPNADCIVLYGGEWALERSVIAGNRVTMSNSLFGGITLFDNVSHTFVAGNRVRGSGAYAIDLIGIPGVPNRGNVLFGNHVAGFDATVADVYLDASTVDTLIIGCHGTVIDEGTDNRILGCADASKAGPGQ